MADSRQASLPLARIAHSLRSALDFRLLVVWVLGLLVPTAISALPIWNTLAHALDTSPLSPELARRFDLVIVEDLLPKFMRVSSAFSAAGWVALACFAFISPFLNAAILSTAAEGPSRGFIELLQRAIAWYGRSFRIWLVSLLPFALVIAAAGALSKWAETYGEKALLETHAERASHGALAATLVLGVLVHLTVEAGRAELATNLSRQSAFAAWIAGTRRALRIPLGSLTAYLAPTLFSFVVAALLLVARVRISSATHFGFLAGFVVTQLAATSIGWGRASRLFALRTLFRPG